MSLRTEVFQLLPWEGGVNTSLDPSMIPFNQLLQADNAVFGVRGSRQKRDGINFDWDSGSTAAQSIIGGIDFWFGTSSATQLQVAVSNSKTTYKYSGGTRTALSLDASTTAWSSAVTRATFLTFNNVLLIGVDGSGNLPRKWAGSGDLFDLGGTPPAALIFQTHLGRVFANDKTNKDRLHYSTTGNAEEWGGAGDSGALDIGIGDGDPEGITCVFPTFKGALFVAKRTKLYRVTGDAPENFNIELVTSGFGCVGPNAYDVIDNDDIIFVSDRGAHSLQATTAYGDFASTFLSKDIQKTFNDKWLRSRLKFIKVAYVSNLNSVLFAVTDSDDSLTENKTIWLYNFDSKAWYKWSNISCQAMFLVSDSDKRRVYLGTSGNRVAKTQNGTNYDINESGTNTPILFKVKTGFIYTEKGPYILKAFKKFGLVYTPQGNHTITCTFQIDNFSPQPVIFEQITTGTALLGVDFTLGSSTLGYTAVDAPYTQSIDGYGRGFQLTIEQSGIFEVVEIQGFFVEYETSGTNQETR